MYILCTLVLIVAECNVNKNDKFLQKSEHYVLIVAECNVNVDAVMDAWKIMLF